MGAPETKFKKTKKELKLQEKIERHELLNQVPEMCLPYSVRQNPKGEVLYFNKELLLKMGLINPTHNNRQIKKALLNQFNLQIINEYDRIHHTQFKASEVKPFSCFATKYLQLQHKNKQGRTSGDGRAIWNGSCSHQGKVWDISSRGTGVTSFAPGMVEAGKALPTGSTDFGYSCGLSELDEIYASIVMSERMHRLGFKTERILACIDIGKGLGICVRASENLIRPAHLFRYLKLNDHFGAKELLNHVIERDFQNQHIDFQSSDNNAYDKYLDKFTENFENLCALSHFLEVFVWLDWDGDNILIDGGIIDYGSIRHFGAHHNKYRYNDIERFSTNLDEQVQKAKLSVQYFAQLVDFVKTGKKKAFASFKNKPCVKHFEQRTSEKEVQLFIKSLGANDVQSKKAVRWHKKESLEVYHKYLNLKKQKASPLQKSSDGKNAWPAFNINALMKDLRHLNAKSDLKKYSTEYTSFQHSKVLKFKDVESLKEDCFKLSEKLGFEMSSDTDFDIRLTTGALMHLIDLIHNFTHKPSEKFKKITDCINYGYQNQARWIKEVQALYRDEL